MYGQFCVLFQTKMHNSRHTLVPVVGFARSHGEGSILEEEGLVSWEPMLKKVGNPSLILLPQAVLVKDGVELPLCL